MRDANATVTTKRSVRSHAASLWGRSPPARPAATTTKRAAVRPCVSRSRGERLETARSLPLSISLSLYLTTSGRVDVYTRFRQPLAFREADVLRADRVLRQFI